MPRPDPAAPAPPPHLLAGKALADGVTAGVRAALQAWNFRPHLVSVLASGDPASRVYVDSKARRAERLGVHLSVRDLGPEPAQAALHDTLDELSADPQVQGIMLELPLAPGLDADAALLRLTARKDIEGLSPANLALIAAGRESEALLPPTPRSVRFLLRSALGDDLRGRRVAVIGPGRTVGRPLTFMLNNRGVTVTLCNEHTRDLGTVLAPQDAVVVAVGRAGLLRAEHVQPHHVVIDAGINVQPGGVVGDAQANLPVQAQTPVPGGVGPLTSALMYQNLVRAVKLQRGEPVE
ncbi:bifunctional 5,10-methylenetetrahydrofolate dehydrogenase/5,10-methenyltetrahydrofolate cyclohydrolase [Deinococcus multiflagellatus]|uniref:bifunctional 5,10-methylenetetrahydrofolate dehydrogenase/5,10-methenyltetrahydrofolate cyclohydrolase n=1 Tax=Deinococcus multiflagellatus TaxID=1656887 RepID=UPI001CC9B1A9|nr:bifunctional 5,10-methylenetetrahydrofolate dehydrogenase/5,10-methenyltetrahydrofolate cyclohydrolase [Deinococcus multiflagellatus]MBZ9713688.1 bifunctional 5,10-methylenetetrahydrofolate dehydrogenase/5,10-methenyltetrahydrofolate cyclohydrolase [Deinococcus multiflagellatus]